MQVRHEYGFYLNKYINNRKTLCYLKEIYKSKSF